MAVVRTLPVIVPNLLLFCLLERAIFKTLLLEAFGRILRSFDSPFARSEVPLQRDPSLARRGANSPGLPSFELR